MTAEPLGPAASRASSRAARRAETLTLLAPVALDRARLLAPLLGGSIAIWSIVIAAAGHGGALIDTVNVAVCAVVCAIAVLARRPQLARRGHLLCAVMWLATVLGTVVSQWASPEGSRMFYTTLLVMEVLGAAVVLDTRWVVGSLVAVQAIWIPLSLRGDHAAVSILTLLTASAFAVALQILLRRALVAQALMATRLEAQLAETTRLQEQLLHAQRMEAVGTLAAGLAHDMNNVLASITSFASLLEDEVRSPGGRADLDQIVAQSMRGAELTRGLLAFSRHGQYRKEVVRIDDIVLEVLPMLERTLPRSILLRTELAGRKLCVEGDPVQLGQALVNLGLNAADAMSGRGTLAIATEVVELAGAEAAARALPPGRYAQLRITDDGVGMDEATRRQVFEPFFTTKPVGKGSGLGLSTVWGIAQAHHGAVAVESSPGHGSTFSIWLPVSSQTVPSRSIPVIMKTERLERIGTVLVVDDEPAVLAGTTRILQRMGLAAVTAADGEQGLAQLRAHAAEIELVILDMNMPVMGGAECFRKLRELTDVPVLIATGYAVDTDVQELVARGAALIEKPYPANDLIREVGKLLAPAAPAARG